MGAKAGSLIEPVGKGQMQLKVDDNPKHVRLSGSVTPFVSFQCDLLRQHDVTHDRSGTKQNPANILARESISQIFIHQFDEGMAVARTIGAISLSVF
jgi:hypothetical protein